MRPGTVVNRPDRQVPNAVKFTPPGRGPKLAIDPLLQDWELPTIMLAPTPAPGLSFDGTSDDDNAAVAGGRSASPDTNGDVGPNHYVQMNNSVFEICASRATRSLGPAAEQHLVERLRGHLPGQQRRRSDCVPRDQLANRWVFSQFAIGFTGHQCFAVSQTPDPTGPDDRYDFAISPGLNGFNDIPKIATWPGHGYYLSANEFGGPSQSFQFPIAVVFERERMLAGYSERSTRAIHRARLWRVHLLLAAALAWGGRDAAAGRCPKRVHHGVRRGRLGRPRVRRLPSLGVRRELGQPRGLDVHCPGPSDHGGLRCQPL